MQPANRTFYTGDNLRVMRLLPPETADLVYLDPPFNKKGIFHIGKGGKKTGFGFKDSWGFEDGSAKDKNLENCELEAFGDLLLSAAGVNNLTPSEAKRVVRYLELVGETIGTGAMAYLSFMAVRLFEIRRLLKPQGSVFLHCDYTASHLLRTLLDLVFGSDRMINELIWCYASPSAPLKKFPNKHDTIFWYAKGKEWTFNKESCRVPYSEGTSWEVFARKREGTYNWGGYETSEDAIARYNLGKIVEDWWVDISPLAAFTKEIIGYPTQKPLKLLKRIVAAASNEGDMVLDPFCGSATTCVASEELGRRWIGIDVADHAAELVQKRLNEATRQGVLGEKIPQVHRHIIQKGDRPLSPDVSEVAKQRLAELGLAGKESKKS